MGNKRYEKYKGTYGKYRKNNKEKIALMNKIWKEENKERNDEINRRCFNNKYFGGKRELDLSKLWYECRTTFNNFREKNNSRPYRWK